MRLLNWRRQAILNAMPGIRPDHIRTPWVEFWRRFRRQPVAMVAGLFVLLLILVAIIAPWIAPFDAENYFDYDRLNDGPSMMHWFGVDSLGRDIFSRVLVGAQISLAAGVFAVLMGAAIGTVLGLVAGYYEGWWDRIIMRICDVLFAFPGILLAIAVVAVMGGIFSPVKSRPSDPSFYKIPHFFCQNCLTNLSKNAALRALDQKYIIRLESFFVTW